MSHINRINQPSNSFRQRPQHESRGRQMSGRNPDSFRCGGRGHGADRPGAPGGAGLPANEPPTDQRPVGGGQQAGGQQSSSPPNTTPGDRVFEAANRAPEERQRSALSIARDQNGDGEVSQAENSAEVQALAPAQREDQGRPPGQRALDRNGDGSINPAEVLAFTVDRNPGREQAVLDFLNA